MGRSYAHSRRSVFHQARRPAILPGARPAWPVTPVRRAHIPGAGRMPVALEPVPSIPPVVVIAHDDPGTADSLRHAVEAAGW